MSNLEPEEEDKGLYQDNEGYREATCVHLNTQGVPGIKALRGKYKNGFRTRKKKAADYLHQLFILGAFGSLKFQRSSNKFDN